MIARPFTPPEDGMPDRAEPDHGEARVGEHLPLPPQFFHVLVTLGGDARHGYGIIRAFEELTGGRETLLPGSLYATLARMVELGLLEPASGPAGEASGGPERRYYRSTPLGRAVARAEAARMEEIVGLAWRRVPPAGLAAEGPG